VNIDLIRYRKGRMKKASPSNAIEKTYPNAENATLVVPGSIYAWAWLLQRRTKMRHDTPYILKYEHRTFFIVYPSPVS
jgi:hypothetical protein